MRGDELRELRQRTGLSQPGLAAVLHVHERTISKWERGERSIPTYLGAAIVHLTKCERRKRKPKA